MHAATARRLTAGRWRGTRIGFGGGTPGRLGDRTLDEVGSKGHEAPARETMNRGRWTGRRRWAWAVGMGGDWTL
ncbi:hypothetical protein TPA0906_51760 [Streptomyces olivaceus]|nr:hypothetical protein TPA0906_51760 [Streptomyces olivaceus]